ncbi:MAG TPA: hypothetical protein VFB82_13930 [Blastocatellia bacterium]|nr:hypothetical protein [Blastocatellia bacterium]
MTRDQEVRLRLFSDNELLSEAERFAAEFNLPAAQISGLLAFSLGEWGELEKFVSHQADRKWLDVRGAEHPTKTFYKEMKKKLTWLREQTVAWGFVPDGLSRNETRDQTYKAAIRVAQEFIQHLSAQLLFQKGGR